MSDMHDKLTGYSSIDLPSEHFYSNTDSVLDNTDKKMFDYILTKNKGFESDVAYSYFGCKKTYQEFYDKVDIAAKSLKKYGINKSDVVCFCLPNIPEAMIYFYACNKIGAVPYLIDPRCTNNRIVECMKMTNSKLLISVLDIMNKIKLDTIPSDNILVISPHNDLFINLNNINIENLSLKSLYSLKEKIYDLENTLNKNDKVMLQKEFLKLSKNYGTLEASLYDPSIPALIANTSGTTGVPKGAMESNKAYNITANQIELVAPHLKRNSTYFGYIPFFSMYGSSVGMHSALSHGIIVDLIPKIDISKFDKIYAKKKPNIVIGVPRLFEMFPKSKYINGTDLSFADLIVMGGDKISPCKLDEINDTLIKNNCSQKIVYGYGSTETMMVSTNLTDDSTRVTNSCGTLYPKVKVRITNRDTKEEEKYNVEGEIYVSTPTLFMGYCNNEQEYKDSIFIDKKTNTVYYKTGDRGYIDSNGILYHTGRYKRLMKRPDGHQVNSNPIEDSINSCDFVNDCVVVGITNKYQDIGVIPTAFIELKENEDVLNKLRKIISIEKEKISGEREMALAYVIVDKIPYTMAGKVDFKKLESSKFEDLKYYVIEDDIIKNYFTKGEELIKIDEKNYDKVKKLK